jgi:hypothetical protein
MASVQVVPGTARLTELMILPKAKRYLLTKKKKNSTSYNTSIQIIQAACIPETATGH